MANSFVKGYKKDNEFTKEFKKLLKVVSVGYYNMFYKDCKENIEVGEALDTMEFHLCEAVYYYDKPFKGELHKPEKVKALAEYIKKYGNKEILDKFKADVARFAYPSDECLEYTKIALDIIGEF